MTLAAVRHVKLASARVWRSPGAEADAGDVVNKHPCQHKHENSSPMERTNPMLSHATYTGRQRPHFTGVGYTVIHTPTEVLRTRLYLVGLDL